MKLDDLCLFCGLHYSYQYKLKFDTANYYPDYKKNWLKIDNGKIWSLTI